ncbi:glutamine synthetase [Ktedonosporobacter rubrisoli]|uniref:glutamine synthetase n=1 Tax=Ktedonosporobacter rubrisoli TaxID=2509675 RepID=A0A4P6JN06_KTERU|nr:glutamine synthetase family protein [Ktedonosporobacter rubrisoli]QBD76523.1 glutamine synthetase [Ktedonosporobacter rubrisoli]
MVLIMASHIQRVEEIAQRWEQQGIRYVIFELADMGGMPRSKIIPFSQWKRYAIEGLRMIGLMVTVDSRSDLVPGTHYSDEKNYGDSILVPDLSTAQVVPWLPHTARVICDPYWPDGTPLEAASRFVLRRVLKQLEDEGYTALMALEYEFYLLKDAASREPVFERLHIFNNQSNFAVPVPARIMDMLPQMGIEILTCNCEYGPGLYEITYGPQRGLQAGDQGFTFKQGVKAIAREQGYHATFMTKPFPNYSAAGAHLHLSLYNEREENVLLDNNDANGLSTIAYHFMQGMIQHAPATMALVAPTPNCFQRFIEHSFAPVNASWGLDDRTALIRAKNSRDENTHLENRLPCAMSNPYLALAAVLAAGLLGLKDAQKPPALVSQPAGETKDFAALPANLAEALLALEDNSALREILGEEFTEIFITTKRYELARQTEYVEQQAKAAALNWQLHEYLEDY